MFSKNLPATIFLMLSRYGNLMFPSIFPNSHVCLKTVNIPIKDKSEENITTNFMFILSEMSFLLFIRIIGSNKIGIDRMIIDKIFDLFIFNMSEKT